MELKISGIEIPCFVILIDLILFFIFLISGSESEIVILGIPLLSMLIGAMISIHIIKKHNLILKKYIAAYFIIFGMSVIFTIMFCFFIFGFSLLITPIIMLIFSMLYFKKYCSKKEFLVLFLCNPNVYIFLFAMLGLFALMSGV